MHKEQKNEKYEPTKIKHVTITAISDGLIADVDSEKQTQLNYISWVHVIRIFIHSRLTL